MTEEQIRAVKGKSFPKAAFSGEAEMRKWIQWADDAELADAYDSCLIHARAFSVWIRDEQERRNAERRHKETLIVDRSARNIGWAALAVSVASLGLGGYAILQDREEASSHPIQLLPSNPRPSSHTGANPVPQASGVTSNTPRNSRPTEPEPEPKILPDAPKQDVNPVDPPLAPPE